jgi:uncharacterized membrane protein YphA (DoxX/SURF4 family)
MTLSVFPSLLTYQLLAPVMIRLALGAVLIFWSYRLLFKSSPDTKRKIVSIIEALAGILLVIGLWTQVAALVIVIDLIVRLYGKFSNKAFLTDGVNYYLILLVLALSLLVTGPGFLAFDMPL